MRVAYPVIFTEMKTNILIEVPDLKIYTEANEEGKKKATMAEAIMMARDAIGIHCISVEDSDLEIPTASLLTQVDISKGVFATEGNSLISLVDVDLLTYRKMLDNKSVRRNVTLPNWLNREAEKAQINVSKVLQEALMATLNIYR